MLADDCAPSHAEALTQSLRYAQDYASELSAMLADASADPDKAADLVQSIRNMLCAVEDELDALDDTQQVIDAVAAIQGLSDADLFRAITDTPTSGNP